MTSEVEIIYRNRQLPGNGFSFFADMKSEKKYCDVTFNVCDRSISAHRIIIAAAIPRLREILSNETTPSEEGSISVPEVDPDVFESFIEYAYTCSVKINTENVKSLFIGACHLNVQEVRDACCDFIADTLHPENVLTILDLSQKLDCSELIRICELYVDENFVGVSQTDDFLKRPSSYVRDVVGRDELQVASEEKVYEAVINWAKYAPEERKNGLPEILKRVRMPLLGRTYLRENVAKEELIRSSIPCRDLLDEARDYHYEPDKRVDLQKFSTEPRCCETHDCKESEGADIYAISSQLSFQVHCLDFKTNVWSTKKEHTFSVCSDSAYVGALSDKIHVLDWERMGVYSLKEKDLRCSIFNTAGRACTVLREKLFVCGGIGNDSVWNTAKCFDLVLRKWTILKCMRECRCFGSATTLGRFVYVLGGKNAESVLRSVERYDFETGRWSAVTPMLTQRQVFGSAALNGKIYTCGGITSLLGSQCVNTAEVYDPISKQWEYISPMKTPRSSFSLLSCSGKLYAFGGKDDVEKALSTVEVWEPGRDLWSFGNPLSSNFYISGAVTMSIASGS